jgi:hypothetical protein
MLFMRKNLKGFGRACYLRPQPKSSLKHEIEARGRPRRLPDEVRALRLPHEARPPISRG